MPQSLRDFAPAMKDQYLGAGQQQPTKRKAPKMNVPRYGYQGLREKLMSMGGRK